MALEVQNHHHHLQVHVNGAQVLVPSSTVAAGSLRQPTPIKTLDLFHTSFLSSPPIELQQPLPLPLGCQKFLNLKTGEILYYTKMSRRNGNTVSELDLKLNLSPPRANLRFESPSRSMSMSPTSPPSSCVSSELNQDENPLYSSSPEATSMVLVGCPRCLMYVMLSEEEPKCPKCKSTVLLEFIHDNTTNPASKKTRKS